MKIERVTEGLSLKRDLDSGTEGQRNAVLEILENVKKNGDQALLDYTAKFDGIRLDSLKVTAEEIEEAYKLVPEDVVGYIREAAENIRSYHSRQVRQSWITTEADGTILGQKITPLDAVGVYVPGGTAAYPSSVLMNVIPAQVAGVGRIAMVSPPGKDGKLPAGVLVAANESGVREIYKVGGAQAIGALAYGTDTIKAVDKITGPGNIYVALAKREVFGNVDIDMIAGPSEIVVLADGEVGNPDYIAADLLSQAEHDRRASSVLVTPSMELAEKVSAEVEKQLVTLPRVEIASASIRDYGAIYVTETMEQAIEAVNELAPEHLEIMTVDPIGIIGQIRHAGAIFLGENSSEPIGDYFAGPNHVLPTNGTARFSSPLNVDDFVKKSSIISYSKKAVMDNGHKIAALARLEGLEAHARAVEQRLK
ncbi:histidinol dehydrogenase [Schinkia azotoformans]|uniref:histidinol dehydrogenase n=1 Tax=Schinkia azotoformans TaxID=1454 RepID=UPI002DB70494|nr:histidinol dehydrogenase [Schinkia azotoformans]MEC1715190.1 histidinol dehydrogenase [Schinkia azotoformans]MEC1739760.1 histidinol dehydrogenase [Schinkia azotoformans]MEC1745615.1 histidinol dehydrogenase [Schinkia azotoformans]MEC1760002.1 histidinol dehydrogenase [Schinkia azotoformans]MEC1765115.1 histidinol dehydrogenase [Schinkia azotoformans]